MIPRWLLALLGLTPRRERELARRAIGREVAEAKRPAEERLRLMRRAFAQRTTEPHVVLGHLDDGTPYTLPLQDFDGLFGWVSGATGSGKTRLALSWLDQILRQMATGAPASIVVFDLKGELTELVLALLALQGAEGVPLAGILGDLLTVRFFRGDFLPSWNLLAPMPGVSVPTQSRAIAEALEHALGMGLGSRQENVLGQVLAVGIERGLTVPELRAALWNPDEIARLAAGSTNPEVRLYFEHRFGRESAATRDGLVSRLDLLLSLGSVRAMVSGRATIDWRERLRPGRLTVLDLGGAPFGGDSARRAVASLALQFVLADIFDPLRPHDGFALLCCDEVQEAVTPATLRNLERIVTTARSFRAGCISLHQGLSQLPAPFLQLLSTNVRLRAIGRSGATDAGLSREWLPLSGTVPRPRAARPGERPDVLSRAEEERLHIEELGRLPRRRFLLADRVAPFGPQWVTAPEIQVPSWESLPAALRALLERGAYGIPRAELEAPPPALGDASGREPPPSPEPAHVQPRPARGRKRDRVAAPEMPDLIEAARTWSRGRRVR